MAFRKALMLLLALTVALFMGLSGCAGQTAQTGPQPSDTGSPPETAERPQVPAQDEPEDVLVITDALFLYQVDDIYSNLESYTGLLVQIEGFVGVLELEDQRWTGIYRNVIDCCEDHPMLVGLDFTYDGQMPEPDDWVSARGRVVQGTNELGDPYPVLELEWLEVLPARGLDTVGF